MSNIPRDPTDAAKSVVVRQLLAQALEAIEQQMDDAMDALERKWLDDDGRLSGN